MKTLIFTFLIILMTIYSGSIQSQWKYPETITTDSIEIYFGDTLNDSYQWLEDMKNNEVENWFKVQANYTDKVLSEIPNKEKLVFEMSELDKVKKVKYSSVTERNGVYFFIKRVPGEEMGKLYFRNGDNGQDEFLFDPEKYGTDSKFTLNSWIVSDNGERILLNITESGKEISFIKVLITKTKEILPLELRAVSANGWLKDNDESFIYRKYQGDDVHNADYKLDSKIMIHKLGQETENDKILLGRTNDPDLSIKPEEFPYIAWFDNSEYIIAGKGTVDNNQELYYALYSELLSGNINWKPLCTKEDEITGFVVNKDIIYFLTSKDATNFKVTETSLLNPDVKNAKLILDGKDKKIESISSTKDFLIITQIQNGINSYISKMNFDNSLLEPLEIPLKGSLYVIALSSFNNNCLIWNSNWTTPTNLYSINLENDKLNKGPFNVEFEFEGISNFVSEEIEIPSHDGVMVPLSIIYDKTKFKKDGSNICYLEGYGAYGISINPGFNTYILPMIKRGMIYAVAHIRGGGEKGEDWYMDGKKTTKPNTWKDFIACGDYLVNNNYTSKEKLAGSGTSAGGILIGRAITERPDLFKVAIPKVGCLNTIRGEFSPNGPVNIPEFGTVTIKEEYLALKEMDAYEHLVKGEKYPATLITTGYNDPRVISWIPGKFAAKLQEYNSSANPVLLDVDYSTGHFGGENITDYFKNLAKIYSFIFWQCGDPEFQPGLN